MTLKHLKTFENRQRQANDAAMTMAGQLPYELPSLLLRSDGARHDGLPNSMVNIKIKHLPTAELSKMEPSLKS